MRESEPNRIQSSMTLPIPNPLIPTPFEVLLECLKEAELTFEVDEETRVIYTGITSEHGHFKMIAAIDKDQDVLHVFTILPNHVPVGKRQLIAEFCARVNRRFTVGCLDLDFEDGELRMHVAGPFPEGHLPAEIVQHCMAASGMTAHEIYPALMAVLHGGFTPEDALRKLNEDIAAARQE